MTSAELLAAARVGSHDVIEILERGAHIDSRCSMNSSEYPENQKDTSEGKHCCPALCASVLKFMVEIVETSIHKRVCLGMGGGFVRPDAQQCERGDRVSQRENKRQERDFHYFFSH